MTPLELVKQAASRELRSQDGDGERLELLPGLSAAEIAAFEASLPCRLPVSVRELLLFCRGFHRSPVEVVDFTGRDLSWQDADVFPQGLPIAGDGSGNFWVVDLHRDSTEWAPIYFASHDAPVILVQSHSLEHFLAELFRMSAPPHRTAVDDVVADRLFEVWRTNPSVLTVEACAADAVLASFARELGPGFQIIDLRNAPIGMGFSWGRYGPGTRVGRYGALPVFAYGKPRTFFDRLRRRP
jgi:cell wall assembly regulator SMI1